jgi:hypothetical protein
MASRAIGRTACRVQRHNEHILGVISDTHGIVRSEALEALAGVEQILLAVDPAATGVFAVIAGHSHRPVVEERGGVLSSTPGVRGRGASSCRSPWASSTSRRSGYAARSCASGSRSRTTEGRAFPNARGHVRLIWLDSLRGAGAGSHSSSGGAESAG